MAGPTRQQFTGGQWRAPAERGQHLSEGPILGDHGVAPDAQLPATSPTSMGSPILSQYLPYISYLVSVGIWGLRSLRRQDLLGVPGGLWGHLALITLCGHRWPQVAPRALVD